MAVTLYQTLHLYARRVRCIEQHIVRLDGMARALFGYAYAPDPKQLEREVQALATKERYPDTVSGFVRLELNERGEARLSAIGTSLYEGYALRSLRPTAITIPYELPLQIDCSTAAEAAHDLARCIARRHNADEAVRINGEGICLSLGEAELFAFAKGELCYSATPQTVEGQLLVQAAERLKIRHALRPITVETLSQFDELLAVDYRGITSIASCDGVRFMSLRAERLAAAMEQLVTAR